MRRFVSPLMLLAFLLLAFTGILLDLAHERVLSFKEGFLGMSFHSWSDLHVTAGYSLIVVGTLHIFLNRKVLLHYFLKGWSK